MLYQESNINKKINSMKLLFTAFLLFPFSLVAQNMPLNSETGLITYQGVMEASGLQEDLYLKGKDWFNHYYDYNKDVFQSEQPNEKLIGRDSFSVLFPLTKKRVNIFYTISLDFKDGKYRYTLDKFIYNGGGEDFPLEDHYKMKAMYGEVLKSVDDEVKNLILSLNTAMKKEDNW